MANSLIPYSFVPGTKAMASEVNANFLALADSVEEGKQYTNEAIENFNTELESKLEEYGGLIAEKMEPDMSNSRNITNCLLEVPQRINLQLNNGTLTLKAGSVVIFPYGTADKTAEYPVGSTFLNDNYQVYDTQYANGQFFVWVELQSDVSTTNNFTGTYTDLAVGINTASNLEQEVMSTRWVSGATDSLSSLSAQHFWYDTTNNFLKKIEGTTVIGYVSLPFCLMANVGGSGFSTITQVFNGFGYVGSTAWMDKGVKGVSCDGRNSDGTLKNLKWENPVLVIRTNPLGAGLTYFRIQPSSLIDMARKTYYEQEEEPVNVTYSLWYKPSENIMRYKGPTNASWVKSSAIYSITATADSTGKITSFEPKQAFRAADVSHVEMLIKSFNTSSKAETGYIKLGDGVILQWGVKTGQTSQAYTITLPTPFSSASSYVPIAIDTTTSNAQSHCSVTALTTTTFSGRHSSDGNIIRWIAIGY